MHQASLSYRTLKLTLYRNSINMQCALSTPAGVLRAPFSSARASARRPMCMRSTTETKESVSSSLQEGAQVGIEGLPWPCNTTARSVATTNNPSHDVQLKSTLDALDALLPPQPKPQQVGWRVGRLPHLQECISPVAATHSNTNHAHTAAASLCCPCRRLCLTAPLSPPPPAAAAQPRHPQQRGAPTAPPPAAGQQSRRSRRLRRSWPLMAMRRRSSTAAQQVSCNPLEDGHCSCSSCVPFGLAWVCLQA